MANDREKARREAEKAAADRFTAKEVAAPDDAVDLDDETSFTPRTRYPRQFYETPDLGYDPDAELKLRREQAVEQGFAAKSVAEPEGTKSKSSRKR